MNTTNKTVLREAQLIAGSPEEHLDEPAIFATAWAAMKAARGHGFDPARLRPQHLIERPAPTPEPVDVTRARVAYAVRELIDAKGIAVPKRHVA